MKRLVLVLLLLTPSPVLAEMLEALVAARTVHRGQVIEREALMLVPVRSLPGPAYATSFEEAAGRLARRTILGGRLVPRAALAVPDDVATGDRVSVIHRSGALTIRVGAEALGSARIGETILVRILDTGARVHARIVAPTVLEVVR